MGPPTTQLTVRQMTQQMERPMVLKQIRSNVQNHVNNFLIKHALCAHKFVQIPPVEKSLLINLQHVNSKHVNFGKHNQEAKQILQIQSLYVLNGKLNFCQNNNVEPIVVKKLSCHLLTKV